MAEALTHCAVGCPGAAANSVRRHSGASPARTERTGGSRHRCGASPPATPRTWAQRWQDMLEVVDFDEQATQCGFERVPVNAAPRYLAAEPRVERDELVRRQALVMHGDAQRRHRVGQQGVLHGGALLSAHFRHRRRGGARHRRTAPAAASTLRLSTVSEM